MEYNDTMTGLIFESYNFRWDSIPCSNFFDHSCLKKHIFLCVEEFLFLKTHLRHINTTRNSFAMYFIVISIDIRHYKIVSIPNQLQIHSISYAQN